jgi:uncharacterized protein YodC (DUF2158 family)
MTEFAIGDVVVLKSGGPRMTIGRVDEEHVRTLWFVDGVSHRGIWPMACVVLAAPRQGVGVAVEVGTEVWDGQMPALSPREPIVTW